MKRGSLLIISLSVIILLFSSVTSIGQRNGSTKGVTGDTITGNATSANVAVSISIVGLPTLVLTQPTNGTYFTNKSLELDFTVSGQDSVWYNLDLGSNITLFGNTTFDASEGQHTIYLYANNSYGISEENVTFTVKLNKFIVIYDNYQGNGSSTNFNDSSFEQIQNLSGIILEKSNEGKIVFNQAINLTNLTNLSSNKVDLDKDTNISLNNIGVNTTSLPNFNVSATLSLYHLSFSNPRILKDGSLCPQSICTIQSYSGGNLVFNVTGFSFYKAEETPGEVVTPTPAAGGGGGGGGVGTASFSLSPDSINLIIKQGETQEKTINITNTGSSQLKVSIAENKLTDFVRISDSSFLLNPGESRVVILDFLAREDSTPEVYMGKIVVSGNGVNKEILVAVNVESKESLFDVEATIPDQYLNVAPGSDLLIDIKIYNLGIGRADAQVDYEIKDSENKTITSTSDTVAVETQASFTKTINIPGDTPLGKYLLYVRVTYNGKIASSSVFFNVAKPGISQTEKMFIGIIIVLFLIIAIILYYFKKRKKKNLRKRRN